MSLWTAWKDVAAAERAGYEAALEPLAEVGFVVTSREVSRDGPWRIEIYGEGERGDVADAIGDGWQWQDLADRDWVAENQRSFQPFAVGPFWVHPSHNAEGQPAGTLPLLIDAGMAFGTGTHATTRGCLEMLATLDPSETSNAVDVGCGSGILAIAMAKLWQRKVIGGDNDAQCRFMYAVGLRSETLQSLAPYDLVVANILAGPLMELAESFSSAIRPGGRALLSGLLLEQADDIVAAYRRSGFTPERHIDLETGGAIWRTLLLRRT